MTRSQVLARLEDECDLQVEPSETGTEFLSRVRETYSIDNELIEEVKSIHTDLVYSPDESGISESGNRNVGELIEEIKSKSSDSTESSVQKQRKEGEEQQNAGTTANTKNSRNNEENSEESTNQSEVSSIIGSGENDPRTKSGGSNSWIDQSRTILQASGRWKTPDGTVKIRHPLFYKPGFHNNWRTNWRTLLQLGRRCLS